MAHFTKTAALVALVLFTTIAAAAEQPSSTSASYGDWLLRCRTAVIAGDVKAGTSEKTIKLCELRHTISVMAQTAEGAPACP